MPLVLHSGARYVGGVGGAFLALGGVVGMIAGGSPSDGPVSTRIEAGAFTLACALVAWRSWGWSLRVSDQGLEVRNFLRSRRLAWAQISRLSDGWDGRDWLLTITDHAGRSIVSTASTDNADRIDFVVNLARQHQVVVEMSTDSAAED